MKKKFIALLLGISFALTACGEDEETSTKTSAADPEDLYMQKCSSCHGTELQGSGEKIPSLAAVGSKMSQDEIEEIIANGKGIMAGGYLKGDDAVAVAEWLAEKK